jgi:micrococcal nuclease
MECDDMIAAVGRRSAAAALAALLLAGCGGASPAAGDRDGARRVRVVAIVDGDTIKVRAAGGARETVRLIGIDTPESKRPHTPVECGAKRASAALRAILAGHTVTLRRDPTQDAVDRYGRTLAYVDLSGRDAGEAMIRGGWAKPYVYDHVPFERVARYRAAASDARRAHRGVHAACASDFHRGSA